MHNLVDAFSFSIFLTAFLGGVAGAIIGVLIAAVFVFLTERFARREADADRLRSRIRKVL